MNVMGQIDIFKNSNLPPLDPSEYIKETNTTVDGFSGCVTIVII